MLKKGSYITNPETKRPIIVGGRIYMKLLKKGIFGQDGEKIEDDHILCEYDESSDIQKKKNELTRDLPSNMQAVKGRGRYKGKVVKRYKKPQDAAANITKNIRIEEEREEKYEEKLSNERLQARELMSILKGLDHTRNIEEQLEQIIKQQQTPTVNPNQEVEQDKYSDKDEEWGEEGYKEDEEEDDFDYYNGSDSENEY